MAPNKRGPTQEEIDYHVATGHAVHRSWCAACMHARGVVGRHLAKEGRDAEDADPVVSLDYAYLRYRGEREDDKDDEEEDEEDVDVSGLPRKMLILVAKDRRTGMLAATAVRRKGADDHAAKWLSSFVRHLGYRRLHLQSDSEAAIIALKAASALMLPEVEVLMRESPPGEHASNGEAEVAVREIKRQIRTLRFALEARLGKEIGDEHHVLSWLPMAAGNAISHFRLGSDGATAEMRRSGRAFKKSVAEFGEQVHYRALEAKASKSGMAPKLHDGIFLGHHARSGALLIMTTSGVVKAAGFTRVPEDVRWGGSSFDSMVGLPWDVSGGLVAPVEARPAPAVGFAVAVHVPDLQSKRRYVTRADLDRYGATPGCQACVEITVVGSTKVAHSEECRLRIGQLMAESPEGRERLEAHRRRNEATEAARAKRARTVGVASPAGGSAERAQDEPSDQVAEEVRVRGAKRPNEEADAAPEDKRERLTPRQGEKRAAEGPAEQQQPVARARASPSSNVGVAGGTAHSSGGNPSSSSSSVPVPAEVAGSSHDVEELVVPGASMVSGGSQDMLLGNLDEYKRLPLKSVASLVKSSWGFWDRAESLEAASLLLEMQGVDLSELYSPARFHDKALGLGLSPGLAVDLSTGWDLGVEAQRSRCSKELSRERPRLLIASPPCTAFSALQNLSIHKRDPKAVQDQLREADLHLSYAISECVAQMDRGGIFLFEQPASAKSWGYSCVQDLLSKDGVVRVVGPMCRWGLRAIDKITGREGFVRKPTAWMTNHAGLAAVLQGWCECLPENGMPYRHVRLMGGLAAPAARYPAKLVIAILKVLREDLRSSGELSDLAGFSAGPSPHETEPLEEYVDDVHGRKLDAKAVRKARQLELDWCRRMGVWQHVPRQVMIDEGLRPISLRWVDTNKGDESRPNIRSRICAREIKRAMPATERPEAAELFSGMPPLECLKALLSIFVGHVHEGNRGKRSLLMCDVSRAHFHGVPLRRLFIELPDEEKERIRRSGDEGDYVGLLLKTMYGTVDASARWQAHYKELLEKKGFKQGLSNPALFYSEEHDVRLLVHGDDFCVELPSEKELWFQGLLSEAYEFKVTGCFRSDAVEVQEAVYLNRVLRWLPSLGRVEIEPDTRHVETVLRDLGLQESTPVSTPAVRKDNAMVIRSASTSPPLDDTKTALYRSVVMRINYLSLDRPDLSQVACSLARAMKKPLAIHWEE